MNHARADLRESLATATRPLFFDGAMGTQLQLAGLSDADFIAPDGRLVDGCNEILVYTRPDVVRGVHDVYLEAGADIVETNTFGAMPWVLAEFELADHAYAISKRAAEIAREACDAASTVTRPRFVAASVGPGTRLPTLGQIGWAEMRAGYVEVMRGVIDGGADLIQIETCQDLLQIRCALAASRAAFAATGRSLPVAVTVTVETIGTLLVGSEISAALAVIESYPEATIVGLNCATGPAEMASHVRELCQGSRLYVAVLPNAGLPENVGGQAVYPLTPDEFADAHARFVSERGVALIGGCCGTTAAHIRAMVERCSRLTPALRTPSRPGQAASLYSAVDVRQQPAPLLIGERSNANGSKQFRDLLLAGDWDGCVAIGREAVAEGAHLVDLCTAYVGRDEVADTIACVSRFATQVPLPLVIDSTEVAVVRAALELFPGRAVINSIHYEDGGERLEAICALAREHGALLIALTIDEAGMAKTTERKIAIAKRIYERVVDGLGFRPEDLFFDTLTFTLGSGDADFRDAGVATLDAIEEIGRSCPGAGTVLGISNISFGLRPAARHALNSVFLARAVDRGLSAAIVHAGKIRPLSSLDPRVVALCNDLIDDRRREGYDPLMALMALLEGVRAAPAELAADLPIEEELVRRIVEGHRVGLETALERGLATYPATEIINQFLLAGMREVGELFGSGKMQLPFVLQAAEVMKAAVAWLEPHMDRDGASTVRGRVVLATVKGDVHDIGKNLVAILLSNNGYEVVDLGIKVPFEPILHAWEEHQPDIVGLSGLLVRSTVVMKEILEEFGARGLLPRVVLGGAALTRRYVEEDLRRVYRGEVYYAADAFDGLGILDEVTGNRETIELTAAYHGDPAARAAAAARIEADATPDDDGEPRPRDDRRSEAVDLIDRAALPRPAALGVVQDIAPELDRLWPLINEIALFKGQWQLRRKGLTNAEYDQLIETEARPDLVRLQAMVVAQSGFAPRARYGVFAAAAEGNVLRLYDGLGGGAHEVASFDLPRQRARKRLCISDFVAPLGDDGPQDVVGLQAVTLGEEPTRVCQALYAEGRYRDYFQLHGLAVETAEALAEYAHRLMRIDLGIGGDDGALPADLIRGRYRGARFSFGYPACPDLAAQVELQRLLDTPAIGLALSETWQWHPEQSTAALVVHHPKARYFSVT